MTAPLDRLLMAVLGEANSPMPVERIVERITEGGHRGIREEDVLKWLKHASCNGKAKEVQVPGRTFTGWVQVKPRPVSPEPTLSAQQPKLFDQLYDWQKQAVCAWRARNHRGIVEAVTGSGKTMVALAAWEHMHTEHRPLNTLIVVPTIELMNQWYDRFKTTFPERGIGRIGDGHHDDFPCHPVCISVINSAVNHLNNLFAHVRRGPIKTFLIADECHRYIDPLVFSRIRMFPFNFTLGLSATIEPYMVEGLGSVVTTYTFQHAVRDGLVPRFDLVNAAIPLQPDELDDYLRLTEKCVEQFDLVKRAFSAELGGVPDDQLFRKLQSMAKREDGTIDPLIGRLFGLLFRRVKISYTAELKMQLARDLCLLLLNEGRKKMLVFFERIRSAQDLRNDVEDAYALELETAKSLASAILDKGPNWCRVLHSGLTRDDRHAILDEFKNTKVAALLACRVLDEGLDVPEIDAAILVASSQSKRQRIQRIGRALRKGDGNKRPLIITLYVPETTDRQVVADDDVIFGEAAIRHSADERTCMDTARMLLRLR